jgi:putative restriction endonuclease
MDDLDTKVRLEAFEFLQKHIHTESDILAQDFLAAGFSFEGRKVPLISPQGIFKPAILPEIPLTIRTAPIVEGKPRPYDDEIGEDGLIRYRYRGEDPMHKDNVGLRRAMQRRVPLIYLYGVAPGQYAIEWPVYVVADNPATLCFTVVVGDRKNLIRTRESWESELPSIERAYLTVLTQRRLHQQSFRLRVIHAYRESCAVCQLRHAELLDASHILPDGHPKGEPWVSNGLALCKLHHAAFDNNILGVRPDDLVVEIRKDILDESDGPMLMHGLQECHNKRLVVLPGSATLKPKREFLEERYEIFRKAG